MKKAILIFLILFQGCISQVRFKTVLVMNEPNGYKIKVVHYAFLPDNGRGMLVYVSSKPDKETVYCFKFNSCEGHYPSYPDKEIRIIKWNRIVARKDYKAVTDTSGFQGVIPLSSEDSLVLFRLLPLMRNRSIIPQYYPSDSLKIQEIFGYKKLDNIETQRNLETRSAFRKLKLK